MAMTGNRTDSSKAGEAGSGYNEVVGSGKLPMLAEVTGAKTPATADPKKGDGQTTLTSSPDGRGPRLMHWNRRRERCRLD